MNSWKADNLSNDREKVLQFGGGNFLRGFFNWMLSTMNESGERRTVVLVKPTEGGSYQGLRKQTGKFHTILSGASNTTGYEVSPIDNIARIINPYEEFELFLESARSPHIDVIVSNTTESGIRFSPEVRSERQCATEFPGKLTQWLYERYQHHPDTKTLILPCELISSNGEALLQCVEEYAQHWNLGAPFLQWISAGNIFCNTLVDRIVSGQPSADVLAQVKPQLAFADKLAVLGEYYHHWVIQTNKPIDHFLPFDHPDLNIDVVPDLTEHRAMKVKILNGLHTMMVPLGLMNGCRTVADVMQHDALFKLLHQALHDEILPTLEAAISEKTAYSERILERFRNPTINHQLASIALNSLDKFKVRLMPTLIDYHNIYGEVPSCILRSWAALLLFYRGEWQDQSLPVNDSQALVERMQTLWQNVDRQQITLGQLVDSVITDRSLCLEDVASIPKIVNSLRDEIQKIQSGNSML